MGTYEVVKPPVAVTIKDGKAAQWYGKAGAVLDLDDEQAAELGKKVRRIDESEPKSANSSKRGASATPSSPSSSSG